MLIIHFKPVYTNYYIKIKMNDIIGVTFILFLS